MTTTLANVESNETTNNTTATVFACAFEKLATSYKKLSVLSARSDTQEIKLKLLESALSTASIEAVANGFDVSTALVVEQVSLARSRVGNFDALVSKCGILRDEHDVKAFFARLSESLVTSLTVVERVKEATGEIISILWTFAKDSSAQLWVVASNGALWLWDKAVDLFHWIVGKLKEIIMGNPVAAGAAVVAVAAVGVAVGMAIVEPTTVIHTVVNVIHPVIFT